MKQFGTIIAPASIIPGSVTVLKSDDGTMVIGFTVGVLVLAGEFANNETTAIITAPLGSEVPNLPVEGTTLLVAFTEGVVDKGCYVIGQIPGGQRAIPVKSAGISVSEEGLATSQVRQPPKGVGIREYVRGAPYLIRLKGAQPNFRGEFYVEADDADQSPDGQAGTRMCIAMDPTTQRFAAKIREATGASVTCVDGAVILSSPNGENSIQISDDGIFICATAFTVQANALVKIDGATVMLNVSVAESLTCVPGSPLAAIHGVSGAAGVPSSTVYIGAILWLAFHSRSSSRFQRRAGRSASRFLSGLRSRSPLCRSRRFRSRLSSGSRSPTAHY